MAAPGRTAALLVGVLAGVAAVEPPHLVKFSEDIATTTGARCLDGTAAGYYVREQDPKRWVIFLEGGGLCVEEIDCLMRSRGDRGSSKGWDQEYNNSSWGPFSTDPEAPFGTFSQVLVPYCSGDMWLGQERKGRLKIGGLRMSGHLILSTVVDQLFQNSAFSGAEEVIFSGTSAGGVGVIQHTDWLRDRLHDLHANSTAAAPRLASFPLAGLFFPEEWPVLFERFVFGSTKPVDGFMSWYVHSIEGGFLHKGCVAAAESSGAQNFTCFDVSKVLPHVEGDVFLVQNQFDKLQIHDLGLCPTSACKQSSGPRSPGGRFVRLLGAHVRQTLAELAPQRPRMGMYVPGAFEHDMNLIEFLEGKSYEIEGLSLKAAFSSWYSDGKSINLIADTCNEDGPCAWPTVSAGAIPSALLPISV